MAQLVPLRRLSGERTRTPRSLERALLKKVGRAIADFDLIEEGDRIMVCISGGKDSYALLDVLAALRQRAPVRFELLAVNVDQGWPGYRTDRIAAHLEGTGIPYEMVEDHFAETVEANIGPGQTPCSLCSRLRRGVLYTLAGKLGCTKIALGHHADDVVETLMLNLFFSGRLAAMPARLVSDDGKNTVIRPLVYVPESLLIEYAEQREFPIVSCSCPSCGLPNQKRQVVKRLLADLESQSPGLKQQMLAAVGNVHPSHLLDRALAAASRDFHGSRGPGF